MTVAPPYLNSIHLVDWPSFIQWLKCFSCIGRSSSGDLVYSIEILDVVSHLDISIMGIRYSNRTDCGDGNKNE